MSFVKDVRINVNTHGTTAYATFVQLFEGAWQHASLSFTRPVGTRTWKPIANPDVLGEARTEVTRQINARHGALPAGNVRRNFKRPTHIRMLPVINAPADVVMRDADAPPVTPVKPRMTPVTPVTPQSSVPDACECVTHTNTYTRGSGKWRSHAVSFGCVGEPEKKAEPAPVADDYHATRARDADRVVEVSELAQTSGANPGKAFAIERKFFKDQISADDAVAQLLAMVRN